jgi:hypothetical protein
VLLRVLKATGVLADWVFIQQKAGVQENARQLF